MQFEPIVVADLPDRSVRCDLIVALVLAALLTYCWALNDWPQISRLILPDTDDMMRLAQVRDWLAGQRFDDWTQYRVSPPQGAPMHWSRVNDFGIAAIILAARPMVGQHGAELAAVIGYPAILFTCHIFLSARVARRLWPREASLVAGLLAGFAFPGTGLFIPGRIDHHALQIVLIEATMLALLRRPGWASGAAAGFAVALSMVVGLETAPQAAALIGVAALFWVVRGMEERSRLLAFAAALAVSTGVFLLTLRPAYWSGALCDAFTPASSTATLAIAAALLALGCATPWLSDWRARLGVGAALGAAAIGATLLAFPVCLTGPYNVLDPFLQRNFLSHINEANSIARQPLAQMLANGGLLAAGCVASLWMIARRPRRWLAMLPVVATVAMSALVSFAQARGAYIGAPAAVPVLAGLVLAARRQGLWRLPALVGAWLAGSGIAYVKLADVVVPLTRSASVHQATPSGLCNTGDGWEQIARYPAGVTMASPNIASYVIGATHLSTVGAGYHRDNRGLLATYRYFLGTPERAAAVARAWNVRYVVFCPGDLGELDVTRDYPHSVAAMLQADRPPPGFERLPLHGARLRFYRIAR